MRSPWYRSGRPLLLLLDEQPTADAYQAYLATPAGRSETCAAVLRERYGPAAAFDVALEADATPGPIIWSAPAPSRPVPIHHDDSQVTIRRRRRTLEDALADHSHTRHTSEGAA